MQMRSHITKSRSAIVAGETVRGRVTSLREVRWDSFQPNFFVVFSPGVLEQVTGTLITSVHVDAQQRRSLAELVRQFPEVTIIDIDALGNPDRELEGMPIQDRFGNLVGHFRRLTVQDRGHEKAVITLYNDKTVVIEEDHLRFDPNNAMVVADLSYDELNRYPARF